MLLYKCINKYEKVEKDELRENFPRIKYSKKYRKNILHDCYYNSFVEIFFIISEKELIIHIYIWKEIYEMRRIIIKRRNEKYSFNSK